MAGDKVDATEKVLVGKTAQVAVPRWMMGSAGTLATALVLAMSAWVVRTGDAPERIATLEAEVRDLRESKVKDLAQIQTDVALMQRDISSMRDNVDFIKGRLPQ